MFNWDDANLSHIAEHDITVAEAEQVVQNNPLEIAKQHRSGEERLMLLGETSLNRVLIVVTTQRSDKTRVVTAFPANRSYRTFYIELKAEMDNEQNSS